MANQEKLIRDEQLVRVAGPSLSTLSMPSCRASHDVHLCIANSGSRSTDDQSEQRWTGSETGPASEAAASGHDSGALSSVKRRHNAVIDIVGRKDRTP
jgi:hypothetical protein